jgi:pSer/pThr/pTyr-binding forkhead associated (FHA) protein
MSARLVAIAGPFRGNSFPLAADEFTIGRDPASSLCLEDPAVSRNHCVIKPENGRWRIVDLDSRNGTLVNSTRIKSHTLAGGEEIQVGQSAFVLALEYDAEADTPVRSDVTSTRTIVLAPENSVYLRPASVARESAVEQQLAALLRFSS